MQMHNAASGSNSASGLAHGAADQLDVGTWGPSLKQPRSDIGHRRLLIPLALTALYVAQCFWFIGTQSMCYDEPGHLDAGLSIWRHGDYTVPPGDHPPLQRVLGSVILAAAGTVASPEAGAHRVDLEPERSMWLSRPLIVLLGLLLAWLLWANCKRWFSESAANFALALFAISPEVIGHYSVVTTDGAGALSIFLLSLALANWWLSSTTRNAVLLGFAAGVALLAKFYAIPLVLLVFVLVLIRRSGERPPGFLRSNWRAAMVIASLAVLIVWAGYSFHTGWLTIVDHKVLIPGLEARRLWPFPLAIHVSVPVPAPEFVVGAAYLSWHNELGHPTFLLGRITQHGWLLYYPIVMLLKWPVIILGIALVGGYLLWRHKTGPPGILFVVPGAFLAIAILLGHIQIGVRHLLPVYPFLLVLAAAAWQFSGSSRQKIALLVLAGFQLLDTARHAPNQISYFNVFVPERSVYRIVTDSNVDWGLGLLAVREYQQQHPDEALYIQEGGLPFEPYGIRARRLHPGQRVAGTVIVSPTDLSGQFEKNPKAYQWLLKYPITAVLDHSLYVFKVPAESEQSVPRQ